MKQKQLLSREEIESILSEVNRQISDLGEDVRSFEVNLSTEIDCKPYGTHPDYGTDVAVQDVHIINAGRMAPMLKPLLERRGFFTKVLAGETEFSGTCEECQKPIGIDRFLAVPTATRCTSCANIGVKRNGNGSR